MNVSGNLTVTETHELTEKIERDIERVLKNTGISIHIEPAGHE